MKPAALSLNYKSDYKTRTAVRVLFTALLLGCGLALGIWYHWNDPAPGLRKQVLSSLPRAAHPSANHRH